MTSVERALLDHAPEAVFWTRTDGSFAYVNQTACRNLGYPREELLRRSIFDVDTELDPEFWKRHWSNHANSDIVRMRRFHTRRDGSRMPVEVQVQQIEVEGDLIHFSFVRDLNEELESEAQRKSHISYLNALFQKSPVPQLIIDPESGDIVEVNPAAVAFYGYAAEALCSMTIQQINLMPEAEVRREMQRARNRERNFFSFRHTDAQNRIHHVHVFSVPIVRNGERMLHSTVLDVTEIVESRHELEQYKALVERLPVGVYQATPGADGVILAANPALSRIFGLESEHEMIGRKVADFYANPEERAEISERVLKAGRVFRDTRQAVTVHGEPRWIAITSRATELADQITILEGSVEDVTELRQAESELARASARAANALRAAPIPMMLYTAEGRIEAVNRVWCEISGYSPDQLQTLDDWTRLAYAERAETVRETIANMVRSGQRTAEGDFRIRCASGEVRIWSFFSGPLEFDGDKPRLVLSTAIDVTEQRKHEHHMRQAEAIIQSAHEGITITGPDRTIERVNTAFTRITGYRECEVRGRNPRILSSGRQDAEFYERMWAEINEHDHWQGEIWNRRKSGEIYPEWLSVTAIRDEDGAVANYVGVFTDLTELKRSQTDLEQLQHFDLTTGLPNRRMLSRILDETLETAQANARRAAVLICGLDRFRIVNESFSYAAGDRVLKSVANRLRETLDRRTEIARLDSDQFAFVIVSGASRSTILDLVDRIASIAARPIELDMDQRVNVQFTIGIARFPGNGSTPQELLRNAETAMFHAKRTRRGSHAFFAHSQTRGALKTLTLDTEMRQAIEDGVFDVHLQPVVQVSTNAIVGAEALARWIRPDQSTVPPDVFIPLAEQSGQIGRLSFQLLEKACRAATAIRKLSRRDFRLAFNISAIELNDQNFSDALAECLARHELDPEDFELELTESTLMEQASGSSRMLKRLRRSGIRISIDDFGTGFSSLAYLQQIDAQVLKIDRRFINEVATKSANAQIAASIIAMAHTLQMDVIAEGVETREQLEFLRQHGCDFYQGYLFSQPLTLVDFEALYRRQA